MDRDQSCRGSLAGPCPAVYCSRLPVYSHPRGKKTIPSPGSRHDYGQNKNPYHNTVYPGDIHCRVSMLLPSPENSFPTLSQLLSKSKRGSGIKTLSAEGIMQIFEVRFCRNKIFQLFQYFILHQKCYSQLLLLTYNCRNLCKHHNNMKLTGIENVLNQTLNKPLK